MTQLDELVAELASLGSLFRDAGQSLYLVGGIVRDGILGTLPPIEDPLAGDIDLTTDARPDAILAIVRPLATALWTQGERFGTIGAQVDGRPLEITTHRAEVYDEASRKPVVTFGDDLEIDLSRRDFTINAMALSVLDGALIDPYGGADDLAARVLRTPLDPLVSFGDDPLRMLRAARFIPRFDLIPDADLVRAAVELRDRLEIVSVERIHDEFERLLGVDDPAAGLQFALDTGLLATALGTTASEAVLREAARLSGTGSGLLERRSRLLHVFGPEEAAVILSRLRYSTADRQATLTQLELAKRFASDVVSAATVRRAAEASRGADASQRTDIMGSALGLLEATDPASDRPDKFRVLLDELMTTEDLGSFAGPFNGGDLIARFGLSPGPIIGGATDVQRELRFEQGSVSVDEADAAIRAWLETQSAS